MKPSTLSLFEREMRGQVESAREAVRQAEGRNDPLLTQAAQSHLDSLLDLARRNGVVLDEPVPAQPLVGQPLAAPAL